MDRRLRLWLVLDNVGKVGVRDGGPRAFGRRGFNRRARSSGTEEVTPDDFFKWAYFAANINPEDVPIVVRYV